MKEVVKDPQKGTTHFNNERQFVLVSMAIVRQRLIRLRKKLGFQKASLFHYYGK